MDEMGSQERGSMGACRCCLPVSRDGQAALFTALRREGSWRDSRKNSGRSSGRDSGRGQPEEQWRGRPEVQGTETGVDQALQDMGLQDEMEGLQQFLDDVMGRQDRGNERTFLLGTDEGADERKPEGYPGTDRNGT
ncbi:MAG: hypothetical protein ACLR0U_15040 [Enterocloster clostridioformis]